MTEWKWKKFDQLTREELYAILAARQEVFAVEQNIVYQDCDGRDQLGWHLCDWQDGKIVAYLRVLPAGSRFDEISFGRVLTTKEARGQGLGKELTQRAIGFMQKELGESVIRISAQSYLEKFYGDFGFKRASEDYIEEDISHLQMVLKS